MLILKIGVLTCVIYLALTILLEAGILAATYLRGGFGFFVTSKNLFWAFGVRLAFIFGVLWVISFTLAWSIVYASLKVRLTAH
jgi:hypothetical protein